MTAATVSESAAHTVQNNAKLTVLQYFNLIRSNSTSNLQAVLINALNCLEHYHRSY